MPPPPPDLSSQWSPVPHSAQPPPPPPSASAPPHENYSQSEPFPVDALPAILQEPITELVNVFGYEAAIPATCGLAAGSAAIGKVLRLQHPIHASTPANLYIMGVAPSGQHKSNTFEWMFAPIKQKEREIIMNHKQVVLPSLVSRKKAIEAQIRAITTRKTLNINDVCAQMMPLDLELAGIVEKLNQPRLLIEDATSEGIVRAFNQGKGTLALLSDDGRKVLSVICGAYKKDRGQTDEELFLKAYTVSDVRVDRAKGDPIFIEEACMAALILVQPDKFKQLISKESLIDGGFLPRFLLFSSHSEPLLWSENQPSVRTAVFTPYYERIHELLDTYRLREGEPLYVKLTPEASAALRNFRNDVVQKRRPQYPGAFAPFVDRWAENWCREAVVLHALEYGKRAHEVALSATTTTAATAVMNWFINQQLGLLTGVRETQESAVADRVCQLLVRRGPLVTRAVAQSKVVVNTAEALRVLETLQRQGLVMQQQGTTAWMIHPGAKL
jgi:hypothetical protein